jgi:hypothetical protein
MKEAWTFLLGLRPNTKRLIVITLCVVALAVVGVWGYVSVLNGSLEALPLTK